MSAYLRQHALAVQRLLIEADINVERMEVVPKEHLSKGVERIDLYLDVHVSQNRDKRQALYRRVVRAMGAEYEDDGGGSTIIPKKQKDSDPYLCIGIDVDSDHQMYVGIEEHGEDSYVHDHNLVDEGKMEKSFKAFLSEARKPNVSYTEEKTKGVVTKVIAKLEGHPAGQLTKVARQYHAINKALDKLEAKKKELNAALKDIVGDNFDAQTDMYCTRVVQSTQFAATLAKNTHPDDIAEKVEVKYELLVDGLMKLLTDDLKPAAEALLEACTKKWTPEPKSPNLTVKPIEEGISSTLLSWWRGIKSTLAKHFASFDRNLKKLEKQLAAYNSMPEPKVVKESESFPWDSIHDVEDLWQYAVDHLDDELLDKLNDECSGLHIEDEVDHEEADQAIRHFLYTHKNEFQH